MPSTLKGKPMPTIGVDRYTFFPLTTDELGQEPVYGEAVHLPGTVEIAPSDSGQTDVFDADNGAYYSDSFTDSMGHEITNADIPPEVDAMWRGLTLNNGLLEVSGDEVAPYFGVAWRIAKAGGGYRYVRYYKGTYGFASSVGGTTKPSQGASEKQTSTATYTAVKRLSDGRTYAYIDDNQLPEGVTKETLETEWFSDMTWEPTPTPGG